MNFLAHSLLGFGDDALVAGQIAGDFVRGTDLSGLAPRIALGVRMHRAIDARTDAHPAVAALRARFPTGLRRFAGIAIDVGLDRAVARDWDWATGLVRAGGARGPSEAGAGPYGAPGPAPGLRAHAADVGRALERAAPRLPARLVRFAPHLVETMPTWETRAGVAATLGRLSRRSARFGPLAGAPAELERLEDEVAATLRAIWPGLADGARDMLERHDRGSEGR